MRRLTARFEPDRADTPPAFLAIADAEAVEEARLLEFNAGDRTAPTALFAIDGDVTVLGAELEGDPAIARVEVSEVGADRGVALLTIRPDRAPLAAAMFEALVRPGVVIHRPAIYRDGAVLVELIGEAGALQAAIDAVPASVSTTIESVTDVRGTDATAELSDRQREALRAGVEVGYYDVPRRATHEAVAERLGCAASTAAEHLQKAEARLVTAAITGAAD